MPTFGHLLLKEALDGQQKYNMNTGKSPLELWFKQSLKWKYLSTPQFFVGYFTVFHTPPFFFSSKCSKNRSFIMPGIHLVGHKLHRSRLTYWSVEGKLKIELSASLKQSYHESNTSFPRWSSYHRAWYPRTYLWMVMAAFLIRRYFFRISHPRMVFWIRMQAALSLSALIFSK